MKTNAFITTLAVVAVLAVANVAAAAEEVGLASDSQGNQFGQQGGNGQMQEVQQAIENGDYDAWVELTQDHPQAAKMLENINAENFHLLNEMHQARQDGDMERAKEIADELGIEAGPRGPKGNNGRAHNQMREEVRTALENGDYDAWYDAMTPEVLDYINEGNFATFVDMHEAIQAGDTETAEALREQLGLPERQAPQNGQGMKMGQRGAGNGDGAGAQNQAAQS